MERCDILVRGDGAVGSAAALALSRQGFDVALLAADAGVPRPAPATEDVRSYALNAASVALLQSQKVWDAIPPAARTAVHDMRIEGDQPGARLDFSAWSEAVPQLAWIVDAAALERTLHEALRFAPRVHRVTAELPAGLTVLAEGKGSASRAQRGARMERHAYRQRAIAARLVSDLPHAGVARQWFRSPDVLALLPFDAPEPQRSYALVWSLPRERCAELMALNEDDFAAALMAATRGEAGELKLASARAEWPLAIAQASAWSGPGWVLLGDAAHLVHPLAGQGLNLGLADVAALTRVIESREPWRPLSDEKLLRRYVRARALPTWAMGRVTDGLLQLFSHEAPAARELRNRGLGLVNRLTPIKRWLTARALDS